MFGHCVGDRLLWGWCTGRTFKFLAKVTRDVFSGQNPKLFYEKLKKLNCVIYLRAWSASTQSK